MPRATITLLEPVESTGGYIDKLTFRPVWFSELCEHGSPFSEVMIDGTPIPHIDRKKLAFWAQHLLVDCKDPTAVSRTSDPRDHRAIEDAMRGFFEVPAMPATTMTLSSSAPVSPQTTSIV